MHSKLTLRPEQEAAVERALSEPTWAVLNASQMSAGKTVIHVEQGLRMGAKVVVIIGPLGTVDGWASTLARQSNGQHELKWITSKRAGMQHYVDLLAGKPGWYFIGRELFRTKVQKRDAEGNPLVDANGKRVMVDVIDATAIHADLGVVDECFVADTMISTPRGDVPIESLRTGDMVYGFDHATGSVIEVPIRGTMNKQTNYVVSKFGATPNHPYYVEGSGYLPLGDLTMKDTVYGIEMGSFYPRVRQLRAGVLGATEKPQREMLQQELRAEVASQTKPRAFGANAGGGSSLGANARSKDFQVGSVEAQLGGRDGSGESHGEYDFAQPGEAPRGHREGEAHQDRTWGDLRALERGQWTYSTSGTEDAGCTGRGVGSFLRYPVRGWFTGIGISTLIQGGLGAAGIDVGSGMRRTISQLSEGQGARREEGRETGGVGVDYLAIQEPRDHGRFARVRAESFRPDAVTVYNIETSSHNYFANGILVHNCQLYSNRKSVGWKKLMQFQPVFKVACSGTWFGNKVENMWSVARWLWPDTTDRSFWRWADKWLTSEPDYFAGKTITGEKQPGAFANSLPCYIRIVPTLVELETPIERWVDLSPAQRKMYDKMERDMFIEVESGILMTEVPIATRTRLRQITMAQCDAETYIDVVNGEPVEKTRVWFPVDAKSSKMDELLQIIEENPGEPMLIGTDSAEFVKLAVHRLGDKAFAWMGGVKQEDRNAAKQRFIDGEIQFIVAQIAAAAEGVDLLQTACNTVVWASKSDSNFLNAQFLRRVHRTGQDKPVRQYVLKARGTLDDEQHLALLEKELQIQSALAKHETTK